jgi:hypothetical protein
MAETIQPGYTNTFVVVSSGVDPNPADNGMASVSPIDAVSAPRLRAVIRAPDVELKFDSVRGRRYVVELSDRFDGPWLPLGSPQVGTGGELSIVDSGAILGSYRFYRLAITQ